MANIIVVEDDPIFLEYLRAVLETGGYSIRAKPNALEALDLIRRTRMPVDLWIVDVKMPRMNGLEFIQALRNLPESSNTPILLLSAFLENRPEKDLPNVTFLDKGAVRGGQFLDVIRTLIVDRPLPPTDGTLPA